MMITKRKKTQTSSGMKKGTNKATDKIYAKIEIRKCYEKFTETI